MLRADAVSRVVNQLRLITKDDYFPRRTILRMLEDKAVFFLSQKLNDKSLFRENNLYSTLRCFELEPVDMVKCDIVEFRRCSTLMKSKEKLPRPIFSKYGDSILSVANLDNSLIFNQKPLRDYINSKKRKNANILQYNYYIQDDYLYIPDIEVYSLEIQILTLRTEEIESKSGCSFKDKCKSAYEYEFIMSDKIAEVIIQETIKEAVGTFKQIPIDENPNLNSNEK